MNRTYRLLFLLFALWIFGCSKPELPGNKIIGIQNSVISLNGTWKINLDPPENFWKDTVSFENWADIQVPGECQMQGFPVKHDQPFIYKHKFTVPDDFRGKEVFLNFYGVYSHAKVWINGNYIREHFGGFTKWECNITKFVTPGESAILTIAVTDRADDVSYGSGYAKHQIGGILRKVELAALPKQHFRKLWFETDLDENYRNARLNVFYELNQNLPSTLKIELFDQQNHLVKKTEAEVNTQTGQLSVNVRNPRKWDAEHPVLYKVVATIIVNGTEIMRTFKNIGFREIEIQGNKLLVNGQQVKLRGACRHDINPLMGRMTTPEYDKTDVLLAKEANINFIRTSHYPPSESFLDYCDQFGIYVEDETSVCFVGSHRMKDYRASGASQNDSLFTPIYISQLEEMVGNHRNHPSVLIWSIGNENVFGKNFVKSFQWVKSNDKTRPVIYSYPGQVPDSLRIYDIMSMHYPSWKGNLTQYGIQIKGFSNEKVPVLFDEWAHVACYINEELKTDPNVRNFWGQSLDSMYTNVFDADGGLGGAIWCMIDETFMLPESLPGFNQWWGIIDPSTIPPAFTGHCVGYGEWGIVDTWRRKKPEFWNTKKAYSPTKIYLNQIPFFEPGRELKIPVHNRFNHTNFKELKITWEYGDKSGQLKPVNLMPRQKGEIVIPGQQWNSGQQLNISFFQNDTFLVDRYSLLLGTVKTEIPEPTASDLKTEETGDMVKITGSNISCILNKKTGMLENISTNGSALLESGPIIHLMIPGRGADNSNMIIDYAKNWKCNSCNFEMKNGIAVINTAGKYDSITADYCLKLGGNGVIQIDFRAGGIPSGKNLQEFGVKFLTPDNYHKLLWKRDPYFTAYPAGHLGNPEGEADLSVKPLTKYREKPDHGWEMDVQNFYYHGLDVVLPYSNLVRSMKENIFTYTLKNEKGNGVTVMSEGTQAARFDKIGGKNQLMINCSWNYPTLSWGNYQKSLKTEAIMQGKTIIKID